MTHLRIFDPSSRSDIGSRAKISCPTPHRPRPHPPNAGSRRGRARAIPHQVPHEATADHRLGLTASASGSQIRAAETSRCSKAAVPVRLLLFDPSTESEAVHPAPARTHTQQPVTEAMGTAVRPFLVQLRGRGRTVVVRQPRYRGDLSTADWAGWPKDRDDLRHATCVRRRVWLG